jgi:Zn-dependent peptidase ImmA (M78 family)
MWENGTRRPNPKQRAALADVLSVPVELLSGEQSVSAWERASFLSEGASPEARRGLEEWLAFLDDWAEFSEVHRESEATLETASGPDKPPRPLDRGKTVLDARRAPTLADEVRDHYGLGRNALPNLWTFLDEHGVLTCRAALGPLHEEPSVAGAFYNHPQLGFCVLVNASASPGRQTFAMAHAYAHAIFHYVERGIVCCRGANARVERFANAFASHFLVPRKQLRAMVANLTDQEALGPYKALQLASHFRVSYPTILRRLLAERHITDDEHTEMRRYSPSGLARRIGLHPWQFRVGSEETLGLGRYPLSILEKARRAVESGKATASEVASALQVGKRDVHEELLTDPPEATTAERREYEEFPVG